MTCEDVEANSANALLEAKDMAHNYRLKCNIAAPTDVGSQ